LPDSSQTGITHAQLQGLLPMWLGTILTSAMIDGRMDRCCGTPADGPIQSGGGGACIS
jgi:hypothetical protein